MANQARQHLTAITVIKGIITLIDTNGQINMYRQRGIQRYSDQQIAVLIKFNLLDPNWRNFKELPKNISISFEDPEVMGRAQATFPNSGKVVQQLMKVKKEKTGI